MVWLPPAIIDILIRCAQHHAPKGAIFLRLNQIFQNIFFNIVHYLRTYDLLAKLVNAAHSLVGAIFDSICITLDKEMRVRPKERDLEEVFPDGLVRCPFKLSDLNRFLRIGEEKKPSEPIKMPVLWLGYGGVVVWPYSNDQAPIPLVLCAQVLCAP